MPLKASDPTGLKHVDRVNRLRKPSLDDYVAAVSDYIKNRKRINDEAAKAAQIRLSNALARFLVTELEARLPELDAQAGERPVAGALRTANADVSAVHELDGLRLAIEIKPINLAVGRAIWNRFGDIRTFAVNIHLKFPFAVVGGVLAIPTYEVTRSGAKKDTRDLIRRAVTRLARAGGRLKESDAPHLMEGVWVLVYDPDTAQVDPDVPPPGNGLRLDEFVEDMVRAFDARFGE